MGYQKFRCAGCHKLRLAKVKDQRYCGEAACQKARKNEWRRQKYASDVDYRANQKQSTKNWLESVGGAATYYHQYRQRVKSNQPATKPRLTAVRKTPKNLSLKIETPQNANRDVVLGDLSIKSGRYLLRGAGVDAGANRDAILVEIRAISTV